MVSAHLSTVDLFKIKDIITGEIKNSCAGLALLLCHVPRYFSASFNAHPALAVSQEIPHGCCRVWSTTDMQIPSLQQGRS